METLLQDVRYGIRMLRKSPGFTAVAVLTLALGIGASTTMFGVMDAVLLRPLPFRDPNRLVRILSTHTGNAFGPSALDARDFASQNKTFEKMAVYDSGWRKNVSMPGTSVEAEQMPIGLVSADYFEVLGIKPLMGRLFAEQENQWGSNFEVIISYEFWQARFQGDPAVLGKTIRINDEPYTVIGVIPAGLPDWSFDSTHGRVELWTPFVPYLTANDTVWDEVRRGGRGFWMIGRLKADISVDQARADLQRIASNLAARYPLDRGLSATLRPLQEDRVGDLRPTLRLLMGAVLLILLIACSNVGNLLLVRNSGRARELALKTAIGAQKATLIRQFLTENLLLGLSGGIVGCTLAWWGCFMVRRMHPAELRQLGSVGIDFGVLMFALAVSVLSSVVFGSVPAWLSLKVNPAEALKAGDRGNIGSKSRNHSGRLFVASEMAFAVMLLIGTGLVTRSLLRLQERWPGFQVDHLLREHLFLPPVRYSSPALITHFCDEYGARVRALPGVRDTTFSAAYVPGEDWIQRFVIVGRTVSRLEDTPSANFNLTDSHYLQTFAIPLLQGRNFSDFDTETGVPVALVNQAFVNAYFPNEDPIGKQFELQLSRPTPPVGNLRFTIIGVTGDTVNPGLALPPVPQITGLVKQTPDLNYGFKNLIVRSALDPLQLAEAIRGQLHSLDPNLPFTEVSTIAEIIHGETANRRYTAGLLALFACLGVVLALIGVYGVVSYVVAQRTNEVGVRMALGAQRRDVLWLILKYGLGMASAGTGAGLLGAWMLRQAVAPMMFGIATTDPLSFVGAAVLAVAFATAATVAPARRATKVDPMIALRYE